MIVAKKHSRHFGFAGFNVRDNLVKGARLDNIPVRIYDVENGGVTLEGVASPSGVALISMGQVILFFIGWVLVGSYVYHLRLLR